MKFKKQNIKNRIIPYGLESLSKYAELEEITFEQMENDLEEFCYILENCYAGFETAKLKGLNIENEKNAILSLLNKNPVVKISDFADIIYQKFSPYILDTHFSIDSPNKNVPFSYRFVKNLRMYFSDLYVIKKDEKFYVYESFDNEIKSGSSIQLENINEYLYEYPAKGENIYRLGILSENNESEIIVFIDKKEHVIPVYFETSNNDPFSFYLKEYDKTAYIRYNRCYFDNEEQKKQLLEFSNSAEKCKNKDVIVLDIRGNIGGNDVYSLKFFSDLYFGNTKKSEKFLSKYRSPDKCVYSLASVKAAIYVFNKYCDTSLPDVKKEVDKLSKIEKKLSRKPQKIIETDLGLKFKYNKPAYKGKIIILTDKHVASSGESILQQAYLFFNKKNQVVQIGKNTAGCGSFGNLSFYNLSNSGIQVACGFTDYSENMNKANKFHGEGKGFYPDYWCYEKDLKRTIESVLNMSIDEKLLNF